ncbi:unnamed protein product [Closterium sp. NIES-64]|nr:unnamed protein product [Closterium sp. NIES-64]
MAALSLRPGSASPPGFTSIPQFPPHSFYERLLYSMRRLLRLEREEREQFETAQQQSQSEQQERLEELQQRQEREEEGSGLQQQVQLQPQQERVDEESRVQQWVQLQLQQKRQGGRQHSSLSARAGKAAAQAVRSRAGDKAAPRAAAQTVKQQWRGSASDCTGDRAGARGREWGSAGSNSSERRAVRGSTRRAAQQRVAAQQHEVAQQRGAGWAAARVASRLCAVQNGAARGGQRMVARVEQWPVRGGGRLAGDSGH